MLKERRLELGISLTALAQELNTTPQCLSRYENGRRLWPRELLGRVQAALGIGQELRQEWFLGWQQHLDWSGWNRWEVGVDPGPTWANSGQGYEDFYRYLRPSRTPPLEFRRLVRMDSDFEGCVYTLLCEAGAQPVLASPVALHFPHHPLLDGHGKCLGMARRAAFLLPSGWLLWPQITLQLARVPVRVDCLAARPKGGWAALEFDGPSHQKSSWDAKRDAKIQVKVWRFTPEQVFGENFVAMLEACLAKS